VSWQLVREKSLVPKCSGTRRNPADISKGVLQNDISRFESYMPSQRVRGPFRTHRLRFIPETWVTGLWNARQPVMSRAQRQVRSTFGSCRFRAVGGTYVECQEETKLVIEPFSSVA